MKKILIILLSLFISLPIVNAVSNVNYDVEEILMDANLDKEGNLSGDCDFENINNYVAKITPRKQGVGLITSTLLIKQVIDSIK